MCGPLSPLTMPHWTIPASNSPPQTPTVSVSSSTAILQFSTPTEHTPLTVPPSASTVNTAPSPPQSAVPSSPGTYTPPPPLSPPPPLPEHPLEDEYEQSPNNTPPAEEEPAPEPESAPTPGHTPGSPTAGPTTPGPASPGPATPGPPTPAPTPGPTRRSTLESTSAPEQH